jgi:hypothetical protein
VRSSTNTTLAVAIVDSALFPGLRELFLSIICPVLSEATYMGLFLSVYFEVVKDAQFDIIRVHVPSPVRGKHGRRNSDRNLIVESTTKVAVPNQNPRPLIHWLASIEIQIRDVQKAVDIWYSGVGAYSPRTTPEVAILQSESAQSFVECHLDLFLDFFRMSQWKVSCEHDKLVLYRNRDWITVPNLGTKAVRVHPKHVSVGRQRRVSPNVPGSEFCLPIVSEFSTTHSKLIAIRPPLQFVGRRYIASAKKLLSSDWR